MKIIKLIINNITSLSRGAGSNQFDNIGFSYDGNQIVGLQDNFTEHCFSNFSFSSVNIGSELFRGHKKVIKKFVINKLVIIFATARKG